MIGLDWRNRKRAWVNSTLIVLNIMYFLYLEIAGSSEDTIFMLHHGAMYAPWVLEGHEYYRLLTSIFMHFGIHHITNNMILLFVLGDNMERALGSVKYLIFYLLCGIGANVISLLAEWNQSIQAVGAGASGAIFGVIGGLFYVVTINWGQLEDLNTMQLVFVIILSLYHGFTSTGVDNVAHVGGLALGILLAALLYRKPKPVPKQEYWWEKR
ncbi:rhomboid family intramembrane serine protease [Clostridiaceae bacterium]|nr:rhomboid family intramembrane serine protease [Clostridiaceae bacterium]RKI16052.1 rhomboid family intramembrane serine protease [bacterium 1XD21-70]